MQSSYVNSPLSWQGAEPRRSAASRNSEFHRLRRTASVAIQSCFGVRAFPRDTSGENDICCCGYRISCSAPTSKVRAYKSARASSQRHIEIESFGGLEIDDQLELGHSLNRQISRLGTF